jgi:hypothetical protein
LKKNTKGGNKMNEQLWIICRKQKATLANRKYCKVCYRKSMEELRNKKREQTKFDV